MEPTIRSAISTSSPDRADTLTRLAGVVESDSEGDLSRGIPTHQQHESTGVRRRLKGAHEGSDGVDLPRILYQEEEESKGAPADLESREPVTWADAGDNDLRRNEEDSVSARVSPRSPSM
jgi:hypothetical protein